MGVQRLTINYLLEDTVLFGGVKVVFRQADLLSRRGHHVRVVTTGAPPRWHRLEAELTQVAALSRELVPPADITVATYWTTIEPALDLESTEVVHYCQGYEGIYTHNVDQHALIEAAYQPPVAGNGRRAAPCDPALRALRPARAAGPATSRRRSFNPGPLWRRPLGPGKVPRILVMSPFEIDWKGVATALEAVRLLRRRGVACELVRLSQWPMSDGERAVLEADEFHCHLEPAEVARVMRSCHLSARTVMAAGGLWPAGSRSTRQWVCPRWRRTSPPSGTGPTAVPSWFSGTTRPPSPTRQPMFLASPSAVA